VSYRDCLWRLGPEDGTINVMQAITPRYTAVAVLVAARGRAKATSTYQAAVDQAPIRHPANTPSVTAEEHTSTNKADANTAFENMSGIRHSHWFIGSYASMHH
jgi:hypothetical protein